MVSPRYAPHEIGEGNHTMSFISTRNQNLFSYFRGPSNAEYTWQIENNLTKAFVVLLKHGGRSTFLKRFLDELDVHARQLQDVLFVLQGRPQLPDVKKRLVLCITGGDIER